MRVFTTAAGLRETLAQERGREGKRLVAGFVPTMGALHEGHISLVGESREQSDITVVSIFVNPTQFNNPDDLESYPRDVGRDMEMLEEAGADIVFVPAVGEIYPEPDTRVFDFGNLDKVMEGRHRKGHFNGVGQVVSRLFDIVEPDKAFFGEKDFQQMAVVRAMVRELGYGVEIVGCPIVREKDGLAMSSRNTLLSPEHRKAAPAIYKALSNPLINAERQSVEKFKKNIIGEIDKNPLLRVEYFDVVNASTLESVESWDDPAPKRGCIAVYAGNVRLIDNIEIL